MNLSIPALFLSAEAKKKFAKKEVKAAIGNIKTLGVVAGLSDRSVYEFLALAELMEKELNEQDSKEKMGECIT